MSFNPRLLAFALIIVTITTNAQQAAEPTLKDTLDWMHNFAADKAKQHVWQSKGDNHPCKSGEIGCEPRQDVSTFAGQDCSATITWTVTLSYINKLPVHSYKFLLTDLDPTTVKRTTDFPFQNVVIAETTNNTRTVMLTSPFSSNGPQSSVELVFDSKEDANRFVRALKHVIELCDGKPSLF